MATLATASEKKAQMSPDEKPERKPQRGRVDGPVQDFLWYGQRTAVR